MALNAKIKKLVVIWMLLLPITACAQTQAKNDPRNVAASSTNSESCKISDAEREALMNLDYDSFDQSLPNGGWRKYQQCPLLTRELLDAYTARHASTLQKQQWDVLVWHSGQISAIAGDYADAISKMEKTYKDAEKPTDAFLWNPYAKATIAFLEKDKAKLVSEREALAKGAGPFNQLNLRHVDAFIRCFDASYEVAYSENCQPTETNIQRIQSLAIPFDLKKPFVRQFFGIPDFFVMKKVILVGEMHGTKTVPELFANIVAAVADKKTKTLAVLEITQSSQTSIDEFLKTNDEAVLRKEPFFTRDFQDGRSSKAMVQLLKKLSKLPNTTVLCMDPAEGSMSGQHRDTGMAAFINAKRIGYDHTIVLSGNIHSSTAIGTHWDKDYRPMGYELKSMAKDLRDDQLLNILVRYETVNAWNCQGTDVSGCKAYYGNAIPTDYSKALATNSYFVWEGELVDGHNASVFVRTAQASFPFVGSESH